jgi:excisionase family DNA binding protein
MNETIAPTADVILSDGPPADIAAACRMVGLDPVHDFPTCDVLTAGRLLGLGRDSSYRAARSGEMPAVKIGSLLRVPTIGLLRMLGAIQ